MTKCGLATNVLGTCKLLKTKAPKKCKFGNERATPTSNFLVFPRFILSRFACIPKRSLSERLAFGSKSYFVQRAAKQEGVVPYYKVLRCNN